MQKNDILQVSKSREVIQIDLEKVIRGKNPRLLKWLPRFLLSYMKRIVHQDEFNDFLLRTKDVMDHKFIDAAILDFGVVLISEGLENIPKEGGLIIVANHPLGGIDGIALMCEVGKRRTDQKAIVNDILMNLENMASLMIPVNKHGKNAAVSIAQIDQSYASEGCTIVFPAGLVSRKQNGKIEDLEWKKSFVTKAIKYKHDVIPVYIDAQNSGFFYNLARFRKTMGIKANIEMFYLVNETYKQKGKAIKITVGSPISYEKFTKENTDQQWAQKVKEHVYGMKNGKSVF